MCSVMKCSRCGHDNDSDALYCVECGLVLNGAHSCKACHNWLNPGYKYCIYCGKKQGASVSKIAAGICSPSGPRPCKQMTLHSVLLNN